MKRLISKFSDKLLSNQQLRTVKGGDKYCFDQSGGGAAPVSVPWNQPCSSAGPGFGTHTLNTTYYETTQRGNGWG